jgi:hypothetical protein
MPTKPTDEALRKPAKTNREDDSKSLKYPPHKGRTALGKEGVKASDKIPKRG